MIFILLILLKIKFNVYLVCEQLLEVSSLLPLCGPQGLNSGCQGKCRHFYLVSLSPTQLLYPSKNMQYWSYLDPEIHYFLLKMLRSQSVTLSIWKSNSYGIHIRSARRQGWKGWWETPWSSFRNLPRARAQHKAGRLSTVPAVSGSGAAVLFT